MDAKCSVWSFFTNNPRITWNERNEIWNGHPEMVSKLGTSIMVLKQALGCLILVVYNGYRHYLAEKPIEVAKYAPCSRNEQNEQKWTKFKKCWKWPKIIRYLSVLILTDNSVPAKFGNHWTSRTDITDCLQFVPKLSPRVSRFWRQTGDIDNGP